MNAANSDSSLEVARSILYEYILVEIQRYVSRYESGVDPNNRARLFQLYAYYKGWAFKYEDEDYNWKELARHNYMIENYVTPIAGALRQFDNNRFPIDDYIGLAWEGLENTYHFYGLFTKEQRDEFSSDRIKILQAYEQSSSNPCN